MTDNLLKHETSPYLRQHMDNPVHWRAWGAEAFDEAQRSNKPILLSIGYAACHWCHVMAHESFEDPEVAAVMNDLYVNIKVDREERPDVDQLYMNALQLLGEHPGWPLTMFLTPQGDAVWGGTYFPKEPGYGRPGFVQVLAEFNRIFREEPDKVRHNTEAIRSRLSETPRPSQGELLPEGVAAAARQLASLLDPVNGGLRGAPKFPQAPLMQLLWHGACRTGEKVMYQGVEHTLHRMARGGIYDHIGGGLSRYSVDETWLVPHFEKMLYDNAHFVDQLTLAYLHTGDPLFRSRIEETVAWLEREMLAEGGAFAASLDADSEGEEGLFYTWTPDEVRSAVEPDDADFFCRAYGITAEGNFEGRSIPNRLMDPFPASEADEQRLAELRKALLKARGHRVRPGRDDKVLADWNGLMVMALARASTALDRPAWLDLAVRAYRFVSDSMQTGGRLAHSRLGDKIVFPGLSGDHAAMIGAALALHEATGLQNYLADAQAWMEAVDEWHWDGDNSGYFLAASDSPDVSIRLKQAQDDPVANPNAQLAAHNVRLWALTGKDRYRDKADKVLAAYSGEIAANPFAHAGLLCALDLRTAALQIVVTGDEDAEEFRDLVRTGSAVPDPNRIIYRVGMEDDLPPRHPAHGKGAVEGKPAAYVCLAQTCSLPVQTPEDLRAAARRGG